MLSRAIMLGVERVMKPVKRWRGKSGRSVDTLTALPYVDSYVTRPVEARAGAPPAHLYAATALRGTPRGPTVSSGPGRERQASKVPIDNGDPARSPAYG